jgi:3-methyladenine DNA glycosylase/8-oxoguanine DNA glycosylase
VKARLVAERGIGEWTADWFLARHLARPRAWPAGDLGLRKAVAALYGGDVRAVGARLDPWQNLAAHYLLTGLRYPASFSAQGST